MFVYKTCFPNINLLFVKLLFSKRIRFFQRKLSSYICIPLLYTHILKKITVRKDEVFSPAVGNVTVAKHPGKLFFQVIIMSTMSALPCSLDKWADIREEEGGWSAVALLALLLLHVLGMIDLALDPLIYYAHHWAGKSITKFLFLFWRWCLHVILMLINVILLREK